MFSVVKYKHITARGFGSNDTRILWHVTSTIHFSFVIDFNLNLNFARDRSKTSKLSLFIVIMARK